MFSSLIEKDRDFLFLPSAHFASLKDHLFLYPCVYPSFPHSRVYYFFGLNNYLFVFTLFYQHLSMDFSNFLFVILREVVNNSIFILHLDTSVKNLKISKTYFELRKQRADAMINRQSLIHGFKVAQTYNVDNSFLL